MIKRDSWNSVDSRPSDGRPETFAFLGFTHYCARSRDGRFVVKRRTDHKRLTRKLHTVRAEQQRRMHGAAARPASVALQRPARALSLLWFAE